MTLAEKRALRENRTSSILPSIIDNPTACSDPSNGMAGRSKDSNVSTFFSLREALGFACDALRVNKVRDTGSPRWA